MMDIIDLNNVVEEAKRFLLKAEELQKCTGSSMIECPDHYKIYGYDAGLNSGCAPSRTRASVKRAALDLRQELLKIRK